MSSRKENHFIADFFAGGLSAIVSKSAMAPVDRVKLLLQTQSVNTMMDGNVKYKGFLDCLTRVYKEQGLYSFWRGNIANVMRFFPNHSLNFAFKDSFKIIFVGSATKDKDFWKFFFGNLASGGVAGGLSLILTHPLDTMRTKLAADVGAASAIRKYSGYSACARELMQHSGVSGFYRGFGVSIVGVVLFKAMFLGGYDISKALMGLESKEGRTTALSLILRFSTAQVVTTFVGTVCYPLDTLRRLIMMQKRGADGQLLYTNSWQCARIIWKRDGFKGFYVGFTANLVRGIGGAFLLVGYDEVQKLFRSFS